MIGKIKQWLKWFRREYKRGYDDGFRHGDEQYRGKELYTREQLEEWGNLRYNDGRAYGLAIARQQATKSLKEILWQQNQQKNKTTK